MALFSTLAAAAAVPAALAGWTGFSARAISRAFPPEGRFVPTRAGRMHVIDSGEGDVPALFLHGASGSALAWRPALGDRLVSLGRTLLVDRPGHGFSERQAGRAAALLDHQAGALVDAMDALGVARAVVVAHSWAGALACRLALDHGDRVAGLVLIAPATHPWPGGVHWYYRVAAHPVAGPLFAWTLALPAGQALMARSIAGVFSPQPIGADYAESAGIPLVLRPAQFMANAEDVAGLLAQVQEQAPRYGDITCPVTVISGDKDGVVWTHLHSLGLARDVPQTKLIVLPDVGHGPHHAEPDQVTDEIRAQQETAAQGAQVRVGRPAAS
ncbi:MAG: alpha/beta fold hydrolase [Phreatobacter sp.]|uniref:alpha/beta fold hydrolase n=1 Tax=Phreatobacter sp. TaxID=1966341 RepID=UPI0040350218